MKSIVFSVKPGGTIDSVTIGGSLRTGGQNLVTLEVDKGATIKAITLGGTIETMGTGSTKASIRGSAAAV